jgi:hypothetical protein
VVSWHEDPDLHQMVLDRALVGEVVGHVVIGSSICALRHPFIGETFVNGDYLDTHPSRIFVHVFILNLLLSGYMFIFI